MNANDRQEGGDHYKKQTDKGRPQHWDLVVLYGWDYFQSQITKYLMRWKDKHRGNKDKQLEDLRKSRHFLDKYIEEVEKGNYIEGYTEQAVPCININVEPARAILTPDMVAQWKGFTFEGCRGETTLFRCNKCREHVETQGWGNPYDVHGECAGAGYVHQG